MKNKLGIHLVIGSVICFLTILIFLAFYKKLPGIVPIHWDSQWQVNGTMPKNSLVFGFPIAFTVINLATGVYLMSREENRWFHYYIFPGIAVMITIILIALGLK